MKSFIKQNYIQPQVNTELLKAVFMQQNKKQDLAVLIPYLIISVLLFGFLYELFLLNISYLDILISGMNSLPYLLVILSNIVLAMIVFIYKNIAMIVLTAIIFQISSLYVTMNNNRLI